MDSSKMLLRKGNQGNGVDVLQRALNRASAGHLVHLAVDGRFGTRTDWAVRTFQRSKALLPDGIVGPKTWKALGLNGVEGNGHTAGKGNGTELPEGGGFPSVAEIEKSLLEWIVQIGTFLFPTAKAAVVRPAAPSVSKGVGGMHLSEAGKAFIFRHEAGDGRGVTRHPHWPGGQSGVTLGPGYDMGHRRASDIEKDMLYIGLTEAQAKRMSEAAGLIDDPDASSWALANERV